MNLDQYFPILLFILVGAGVGVGPMLIGRLLGPHRPDAAKLSPYESAALKHLKMHGCNLMSAITSLQSCLFCLISKLRSCSLGQFLLMPLEFQASLQ